MPLYEYQCETCGRFELIRKFSEDPLKACPTCGRPVQKLLSAPAIQFKGTGWYVTDYAKKPSGEGAGRSAQEGSPAAKDSGTSTPPSSTTKDGSASGSSPTK